jgi:hypothetical protein
VKGEKLATSFNCCQDKLKQILSLRFCVVEKSFAILWELNYVN